VNVRREQIGCLLLGIASNPTPPELMKLAPAGLCEEHDLQVSPALIDTRAAA
jgi:hypothetical protein